MCDARVFAPQLAALSARHAVQVAPMTRHDTIEAMAEEVLENAPDRFALVGFSMGGIVAMEVLRQRADRVLKLALLDTTPIPETPEIAATREPQIVAARAGRLEEVIREEHLPNCFASGASSYAHKSTVLDMARDLGPAVFVRQSRALQRRKDQQATLRDARLPTLLLCGRHDKLCSVKRHQSMAGLVAGAALEVIDDAAHFPTLEQPEATTEALQRWLSGTLLLT
jgi:pimeloyl-ACP methyl ester carboxylesterase